MLVLVLPSQAPHRLVSHLIAMTKEQRGALEAELAERGLSAFEDATSKHRDLAGLPGQVSCTDHGRENSGTARGCSDGLSAARHPLGEGADRTLLATAAEAGAGAAAMARPLVEASADPVAPELGSDDDDQPWSQACKTSLAVLSHANASPRPPCTQATGDGSGPSESKVDDCHADMDVSLTVGPCATSYSQMLFTQPPLTQAPASQPPPAEGQASMASQWPCEEAADCADHLNCADEVAHNAQLKTPICPRCHANCGDVHVVLSGHLPFGSEDVTFPPDVLGLQGIDAVALLKEQIQICTGGSGWRSATA